MNRGSDGYRNRGQVRASWLNTVSRIAARPNRRRERKAYNSAVEIQVDAVYENGVLRQTAGLSGARSPLIHYETVVNLIGATKPKSGLRVKAVLDTNQYEIGVKVANF